MWPVGSVIILDDKAGSPSECGLPGTWVACDFMWAAKSNPVKYLNYDSATDGGKVQLWGDESNASRWYPRVTPQKKTDVHALTAWLRTA